MPSLKSLLTALALASAASATFTVTTFSDAGCENKLADLTFPSDGTCHGLGTGVGGVKYTSTDGCQASLYKNGGCKKIGRLEGGTPPGACYSFNLYHGEYVDSAKCGKK